jgi:hypothetical protein
MVREDGFQLSWNALQRQIQALPCPLYELRLIHGHTRHAFPGVRHWGAEQLCDPDAVRFLRWRNREGYDVYFRPHAGPRNAGYILLDLDHPAPDILPACTPRGTSRVWWSRAAPAMGRPGFA